MKSKTRQKAPPPDLGERINMTAWRKHYVSSVTAEEEPWPQREPGSNLGRIFVLLLLLHVFIIGAVVLYNIVSPKAPMAMRNDPKPQTAVKPSTAAPSKTETASMAAKATPEPTPAKPPVIAGGPSPVEPVKADPPTTPKAKDDVLVYEVRSGDNVPGIASHLGVDAEELVKMNNLDTTDLYPGRKLEYRNPSSPPAPVQLKPAPAAPKLQPVSLAVTTSNNLITEPAKPKTETLKISEKEKSKSDSLPAPKVKVPEASADEVPKAVPIKIAHVEDQPPAPKPTAKKHVEEAPPAKAKTKNDEPKSKKTSKSESSAKNMAKSEKKESASKKTHIVGPHETLYSISRKFGVSVTALQKVNGIKDPTLLRDGTKLVIPAKN